MHDCEQILLKIGLSTRAAKNLAPALKQVLENLNIKQKDEEIIELTEIVEPVGLGVGVKDKVAAKSRMG